MSTPATRPAPKLSVISRALRRAIEYCKMMFEAEMSEYPAGEDPPPEALAYRQEATEYNALLKKIEPKRKETKKPT